MYYVTGIMMWSFCQGIYQDAGYALVNNVIIVCRYMNCSLNLCKFASISDFKKTENCWLLQIRLVGDRKVSFCEGCTAFIAGHSAGG